MAIEITVKIIKVLNSPDAPKWSLRLDFCESISLLRDEIENETSQENFRESRMRVLLEKLRHEDESLQY